MPTYEYACTACGRHTEVHQRLTDAPLTTCESCGGALRKVFHPAGIVFKGSGFYATDSRSKRSESTSTSTSGGTSGGATGGTPGTSGTSESASKPADAPAAKPATKAAP
ncbi:MAG: FmdB family zinc ribbon protein [Actinomycetota bacterium]